MLTLTTLLNKRVGGSTGTNFWGVLELAKQMKENGEAGSIVTLICDSGERYMNTYYNEEWLQINGYSKDVAKHRLAINLI